MKKINIFWIMLCLSLSAQGQGIHFETGSWKAVVEQAKREKKLIYMDIFTEWCGPCKMMAAQIFPDPKAGAKYNAQFVNYKIDAEKGEGLGLASKYQVSGYPSNLYIDPQTEEVVYRVMGSAALDDFLNRADVAAMEQKDPLKWADYEQKLATGAKDKQFLLAYLEKAERLDKPNDKALDSYVEQFAGKKPDDATLNYLLEHTHTFDNKAVDVIFNNRAQVDKIHKDRKHYYSGWISRKPYGTLEKAIANKDETLLKLIESGIQKYQVKESPASGMHYYRKEYFTKTGNEEKALEESMQEADYLAALDPKQYVAMNEVTLASTREYLIYQLKAKKVPESQFESSIAATIEKNPEISKSASVTAAMTLNETAWGIFERKRDDKAALRKALTWSARAMELAEGTKSWPLVADTYASLLYANGERDKAIVTEEQAIGKAEAMQMEGLESLRETLEKMQSGQL